MAKTLKVLLVATCSEISSGATWSLIGLADNLKKMGVSVTILLPLPGDCEEILENHRIRFHHIRYYSYPSWVCALDKKYIYLEQLTKKVINFIAHIRLFLFIIINKIDIVHINAFTSCLGAIEAKILGRKLVWHVREFMEQDIKSRFSDEKKAIKRLNTADYIVAVSIAVAKKNREYLCCAPIDVIYNGVSSKFYQNHKKFMSDGLLNVLIVGRIMPKKNQLLACQAFKQLVQQGIDNIRLEIIGNIEDAEYYRIIQSFVKENSLDNYISFAGPTDCIDIKYQSSDVVLVCADNEAFGRTTVEAMMSGCLVIGSDSGGTTEIIDNNINGLLFVKKSAEDLSERIRFAINHPEMMDTITKVAQKKANHKFSDYQNAKSILDVYQRVIAK